MTTNTAPAMENPKAVAKNVEKNAKKAQNKSTPITAAVTPAVEKIGEVKFAFGDKDFKPLSNKDADAAIAKIMSAGKSFKRLTHVTAVGIMLHFQKHGDYTKLTKLHQAVSAAMSKAMARGLIEWTERFSSLRWNKEAKAFFKPKGAENMFNLSGDPQSENEAEQAGAMNNAFWSASFGDREPPSFDFQKAVADLHKRMAKAVESKAKAETKALAKRFDIDEAQLASFEKFAKSAGVKLKEAEVAGNA